MTERTESSIAIGSNLWNAIMVQVVSALFIIGGTFYFGAPGPESVWLIITGTLYAIGFVQLLATRYVMQRERNGVIVANIVALLAMASSFGMALIWWVLFDLRIQGFFYVVTFVINFQLAGSLRSERLSMSP